MSRAPRVVAVLVAVVVLAACTGDGEEAAPSASPAATDATSATPTPSDSSSEPVLADVPPATRGWASGLGLPVIGAIRTSTPLADLVDATREQRIATCRTVAAELDTIASPQALTALAITADPETATLLVGDLRAKADLLASCGQQGPEVETLVAEVAATHEVARAWLTAVTRG